MTEFSEPRSYQL